MAGNSDHALNWDNLKLRKGFSADLLSEITHVKTEKGTVTFKYVVSKAGSNLFGNMHGGAYATLADILSTVALNSIDTRPSVTITLSLNCLAGASLGTEVTIISKTEKVGKNVAFADIEFYNDKGVLLATAKHTKMMLSTPPNNPKL